MKIIPPGKQLSKLSDPTWSDANVLSKQRTFFPRTIDFKDIDEAVFNWFISREIRVENNPIPVFFINPEKWAEFKKSWKYMDGDRNVDFPFITIRRFHSVTPAKTPTKGRIPGRTFVTYRFPIYTEAGVTQKLYKVPQPIKVDLRYEIRCLTHYVMDINKINEEILKHFASLQSYLDIDRHYMPMSIENISDESNTTSVSDERILHTLYSIVVNGYIIDKEEFEEKTGVSDITVIITEETE